MAILPIYLSGAPVLHTPARRIEQVTDEIRALADDMVDTMHAAPGVGLAAPQVGHGLQLFVWHYEWADDVSSGVVINPTLRRRGPWRHRFRGEPDEEGCLSLPGMRFPLARAERAVLTGVDLEGAPLRIEAHGWLARIFQHEYDHLQGVLYRDRLPRRFKREADAEIEQADFAPGESWLPGDELTESDFGQS